MANKKDDKIIFKLPKSEKDEAMVVAERMDIPVAQIARDGFRKEMARITKRQRPALATAE